MKKTLLLLSVIITGAVVKAAPGDKRPLFHSTYGIDLHRTWSDDLKDYSNEDLMKVGACVLGAKLKKDGVYSRRGGFFTRVNKIFTELKAIVAQRPGLKWTDFSNEKFTITATNYEFDEESSLSSLDSGSVLKNNSYFPFHQGEEKMVEPGVANYMTTQYNNIAQEFSSQPVTQSTSGLVAQDSNDDDDDGMPSNPISALQIEERIDNEFNASVHGGENQNIDTDDVLAVEAQMMREFEDRQRRNESSLANRDGDRMPSNQMNALQIEERIDNEFNASVHGGENQNIDTDDVLAVEAQSTQWHDNDDDDVLAVEAQMMREFEDQQRRNESSLANRDDDGMPSNPISALQVEARIDDAFNASVHGGENQNIDDDDVLAVEAQSTQWHDNDDDDDC